MPKETKEEEVEDIEIGEKEESPYSEPGREAALEEDSLTDADEGFMQGYESGGSAATCASCGKILEDDFVEKEIDGKIYRFCCDKCASDFEKSLK